MTEYKMVCDACWKKNYPDGALEITLGAIFYKGKRECSLCSCPVGYGDIYHWAPPKKTNDSR